MAATAARFRLRPQRLSTGIALGFALYVAAAVAGLEFIKVPGPAVQPAQGLAPVLVGSSWIAGCAAATLAIRHNPRNATGWLLLALYVTTCTSFLLESVSAEGLWGGRALVPVPGWFAAAGEGLERAEIGAFVAMMQVFPTGRVLSRRWRAPLIATGVVTICWIASHALTNPDPSEPPFAGVLNPWGWQPLKSGAGLAVTRALLPSMGVLAVTAAISVVARARRSRGDERQQLKVVGLAFLATALATVILLISAFLDPPIMQRVGGSVWLTLTFALPLALAIAMSRFRLYDVDLIINRTIVYGLASLTVIAAYAATAAVAALVLTRTFNTEAPVVIIAAALTSASVAGPARRHFQQQVDRRFSRRSWDAVRVVREFARHWHEAPQPPHALAEMLRQALRDPELDATVFLRDRGIFASLDGNETLVASDGRPVTEISSHGEPLALLRHDPRLLREPVLLAAVTKEATLLLENARLSTEVLVQLDEVRMSRNRVIEAAEHERHRIQRDLHDGAQQRLFGVALSLHAAETQCASGSPLRTSLTMMRDQVGLAISDLRELTRGSSPPVLAAEGLAPALRQLACGTPIAITIELPEARFSPAIERTAYFVIAEALTNAIRHSGAAHVTVTGVTAAGRLRAAVCDDGQGGADPAGSGLRGLAERARAVDADLTIVSPPGSGTVVSLDIAI